MKRPSKKLFQENKENYLISQHKAIESFLKSNKTFSSLESTILGLKTSDFDRYGNALVPIDTALDNIHYLRILKEIEEVDKDWLKEQLLPVDFIGQVAVIGRYFPIDTVVYYNGELDQRGSRNK